MVKTKIPATVKLEWHESTPQEVGCYLFRMLIGSDKSGMSLLLELCDPIAYNYLVVTVYRNKDGWLLYRDLDGDERVVKGPISSWVGWWAKLS